MSRGLGTVQRAVLAAFDDYEDEHGRTALGGWLRVSELAEAIHGRYRVSRSEVESVRRACRKLETAGILRPSWRGRTRPSWRGAPWRDRRTRHRHSTSQPPEARWCSLAKNQLVVCHRCARRCRRLRRSTDEADDVGPGYLGFESDYMDDAVHVPAARVDRGEFVAHRSDHYGMRKTLCFHLCLSVEERNSRSQFYADSLDRLSVEEKRIP